MSSDPTALFYQHIWPHRAMVLRTARFLTRNAAEADDVAQETLVKAFKFISQLDLTEAKSGSDGAKAWLSAILRNTWIDRMRSQGRHQILSLESESIDVAARSSEDTPIDANTNDAAALLEQFTDADLIQSLKTLPEEIRWTLLLVDVEQLDHAAAAAILKIPPGTVKSRAHRGRQMLKEHILERSRRTGVTGEEQP